MIPLIIALTIITFLLGFILATIICVKINRIETIEVTGIWPFLHSSKNRAAITIYYIESKNIPTDIERQEVETIDAEIEEMMALCPVSEK